MSQPSVSSTPAEDRRTGLVPAFNTYLLRERGFLIFLICAFVGAAMVSPFPVAAMWFGFLFAGYSAIANDSIQTIGTFISSNRDKTWWVLWLFVGGIFLVTMTVGYVINDGDVSWGRLTEFPQPQTLNYLQITAPVFLLILTRLRMPVSTTILLLTSFDPDGTGISSVLQKSIGGYFIAFGIAIVLWLTLGKAMQKWFTGTPHPGWTVAQWVTSGSLWAIWLIQDAANIAVFLPRQMSVAQFVVFAGSLFFGLAFLFFGKGEAIQQVVDEKSHVVDVRPATIIDLAYGIVLLIKTVDNNIPMSTTWVFIGLLGGRELAMGLTRSGEGRTVKQALRLMFKDILKVTIGLLVSLMLAFSINASLRCQWAGICIEAPAAVDPSAAQPDGAPAASEASGAAGSTTP
jgi:hypothetical protein